MLSSWASIVDPKLIALLFDIKLVSEFKFTAPIKLINPLVVIIPPKLLVPVTLINGAITFVSASVVKDLKPELIVVNWIVPAFKVTAGDIKLASYPAPAASVLFTPTIPIKVSSPSPLLIIELLLFKMLLAQVIFCELVFTLINWLESALNLLE